MENSVFYSGFPFKFDCDPFTENLDVINPRNRLIQIVDKENAKDFPFDTRHPPPNSSYDGGGKS